MARYPTLAAGTCCSCATIRPLLPASICVGANRRNPGLAYPQLLHIYCAHSAWAGRPLCRPPPAAAGAGSTPQPPIAASPLTCVAVAGLPVLVWLKFCPDTLCVWRLAWEGVSKAYMGATFHGAHASCNQAS